jgi:uncharacterized membrane protein
MKNEIITILLVFINLFLPGFCISLVLFNKNMDIFERIGFSLFMSISFVSIIGFILNVIYDYKINFTNVTLISGMIIITSAFIFIGKNLKRSYIKK